MIEYPSIYSHEICKHSCMSHYSHLFLNVCVMWTCLKLSESVGQLMSQLRFIISVLTLSHVNLLVTWYLLLGPLMYRTHQDSLISTCDITGIRQGGRLTLLSHKIMNGWLWQSYLLLAFAISIVVTFWTFPQNRVDAGRMNDLHRGQLSIYPHKAIIQWLLMVTLGDKGVMV